jgi:hypothetical protein
MEWNFPIEKVDNETIKIVSNDFNLSPWTYNVRLGSKWHNVFIDSPIIKFNRSISYYFKEVENQQLDHDIDKIKLQPSCNITLDLYEYKKLQKIDKIKPGLPLPSVEPIMPVMPTDTSKLEKDLLQLTKKVEYLENLIKRTFGM